MVSAATLCTPLPPSSRAATIAQNTATASATPAADRTLTNLPVLPFVVDSHADRMPRASLRRWRCENRYAIVVGFSAASRARRVARRRPSTYQAPSPMTTSTASTIAALPIGSETLV